MLTGEELKKKMEIKPFYDGSIRLKGKTERLKAENQMLWVWMINNIIASAEEIVLREVVHV